mgnify:CR=1 FL=1
MSKLRAYQVAEFSTVVYVSVADEKFAPDDIFYHGRENGLYKVFHVNECDFLRTVSYAEVYVLFDTLRHDEVVFFTWPVHTGGAENDVGKIFQRLEITFGFQLAFPVCRVGAWRIIFPYRGIYPGIVLSGVTYCLFAYGTEHAEGTDENKTPGRHVQFAERIDKMTCSLRIGAEKVFTSDTFGGSGCMYDDIPTSEFGFACRQLGA